MNALKGSPLNPPVGDLKDSPLTLGPFPPSTGAREEEIYARLEREIHGLLVDLRIEEPRRDEFLDQEDLVKRFMAAWAKAAGKIEEKVLKQVERGEKEITIA